MEHIEAGIDLHINANISGKSSKLSRSTALRLALSGMFLIILIWFLQILCSNNISDLDLHADGCFLWALKNCFQCHIITALFVIL